MSRALICAVVVTGIALGAAAGAQAPAAVQAPQPIRGFLAASDMPDVRSIVPAAPAAGDARYNADMAIYASTRALQGSPRWDLARSDDDVSTAGLFRAFSCALGANVTRENAPLVNSLVTRANRDASRASSMLKDFYKHPRPFQVADAPVCVSPERKATLAESYDYPSGHTTVSWEMGLVLSLLAPEQANAILTRARAFGESRVVCGVHNLSAVEAGWVTGTAVFAAQQNSPEFQAALQPAKAELAALRESASPSDGAACTAQAGVLAKDPF